MHAPVRTVIVGVVLGLTSVVPARAQETATPAPVAETAVAPAPAAEAPATLERKLQALLVDKLGDDAATIRVVMNGREAILLGEVAHRSTQELAEEVARFADEVDHVDNKLKLAGIRVGGGGVVGTAEKAAAKTSDEGGDSWIESRVKGRLVAEIGRRARKIEVEVAEGVVSLRGTVNDEPRREIALKSARGVPGVVKVIDLLRVWP
jgi:hyperosmotically inducible periplasmic protein